MSSRFKWTDLIVAPVGLMGPFLSSWSMLGVFTFIGFMYRHVWAWAADISGCILSVLLAGLMFGFSYICPIFSGLAVSRWLLGVEKSSKAFRIAIGVLIGAACIFVWVAYLDKFMLHIDI